MKKVATLILIVILSFSLLACSKKPSGEVYEKEIREAYTEVRLIPMIIYNGKTTTTILIPYTYRYPKRWVIHIKWFETKKDKWYYHEYFVNEEIYNEVEIGSEFGYQNGVYSEEPYERERE